MALAHDLVIQDDPPSLRVALSRIGNLFTVNSYVHVKREESFRSDGERKERMGRVDSNP
jgi:hypothetical protein